MNTFSKFAAITFAVLALGASAQAKSNGGGNGGGAGAGAGGGGGEPAIVMMPAGGPVAHAAGRGNNKRPARIVRSIPIYNCGDGISISSGPMCQPVLR